jgi:DNA processing protein
VPGPIETAPCEGSNRLIADGAKLLVSVPEFVRAITGEEALHERGGGPLGGAAGRVLARLGAETLGVDQVATAAQVPVAEALAVLTELELGGLVRQLPGMRFQRVA